MRRLTFLATLCLLTLTTSGLILAGKGGGKGGGGSDGDGDPPPDYGFTYELRWLTPADGGGATCLDVNNSGVAVGFWDGGGAFISDPVHGIVDLNELFGSGTHYFGTAEAINDSGWVVGWARFHDSDVRQPFRYHYDPDPTHTNPLSKEFELVNFPGSWSPTGSLMRINNSGDVAIKGNEVDQVLVFSQSGSQDPEYTPESYLVPGLVSIMGLNYKQLNDNKQIKQILVSARNADGVYDCIRLSRITGDVDLVIPSAWANGLNDNGDIVGEFWPTRSTPSDHFRYSESDGAYTILSTASGNPRAINSVGDVCGIFGKSLSRNQSYSAPYLYHNTHGFIDVETLLPGGGDEQWITSRGSQSMTFDINDFGDILGRHVTPAGRSAPYVLVRVPKPSDEGK